MTISLIYYINKKTNSLVKSLNSIINQKNKDFQLIVFNDGNDSQVEEVIKSLNFAKLPHFSYFASSKVVGRGYASNFARSLQKSDYVWFGECQCILHSDFIDTILEVHNSLGLVNVISFSENHKSKSFETMFDKYEIIRKEQIKDIYYSTMPYIDDKIYSTKFLSSNNIEFTGNNYFPLIFLYKVISKFNTFTFLNKQIVDYSKSVDFHPNVYQIFDMINELVNNYRESNFWKENKQFVEFLIVYYIICVFLVRTFIIFKGVVQRDNALTYAESWLNNNFPKWKENRIINNTSELIGTKTIKMINKFKFNSKSVTSLIDAMYGPISKA